MIAVATALSSGGFNLKGRHKLCLLIAPVVDTDYKVFVAHVSMRTRFAIKHEIIHDALDLQLRKVKMAGKSR